MERLLVLIFATFFACNATSSNCPNDCDCSPDTYLECPRGQGVKIRIDTKPDDNHRNAVIDCRGSNNQSVYDLIPDIHLGTRNRIVFKDCPMSVGSLRSVVEKLDATVEGIHIQSLSNAIVFERKNFEGFNELKSLIIEDESAFPDDLFDDLGGLQSLVLRTNHSNLPERLFSQLQTLTKLELHMKLEEIKPELLGNLSNLRSLEITGTRFHNLTFEAFQGTREITELILTAEYIEIHPKAFDHLEELQRIDVKAENISSIPAELFENCRNLVEVKLRLNGVKSIPARSFARLQSLKLLLLSSNELTDLPVNLLLRSTAITEINFSSSKLRTLPRKMFEDQRNVTKINLESNNLQSLDDDIFDENESLEVLRLSHNKLSKVSKTLFYWLRNLKELWLDGNKLQTIPGGAFDHLISLQILYLQYNQLRVLDHTAFQDLGNLQTLVLHHNELTSMPWLVVNVNLAELDLSFNKVKTFRLSDVPASLYLKLTLANNELTSIDFSGVDFNRQLKMTLNENPLNCDCKVLSFIQYVQENVPTFDVSKLNCHQPPRLKDFNVKDVKPRDLLCCSPNCECNERESTLLMNCSGLKEFPALPQLNLSIELNLSRNSLTHLPTVDFPGYNAVTVLDLAGNKISKIEAGNVPVNLRALNLTRNALKRIHLDQGKSLPVMELSLNDWSCDCAFRNFTQKNSMRINDYDQIKCDDGRKLTDLEDFCVSKISSEPVLVRISEKFEIPKSFMILCSTLTVLLIAGVLFYIKFNEKVKVLLISRGWVGQDEVESYEDRDTDAFISYAQEDVDFIAYQLMPDLETCEFPYKLCIHDRDWVAGEAIAVQITRSIKASRKTIIVLSKAALKSRWCMKEFREAHAMAMTERRNIVILILHGDIGDKNELPNDLKAYTETNTYLESSDVRFLHRLKSALRKSISLHRSSQLTESIEMDSNKII